MWLNTGEKGTPLKEILEYYGNIDIPEIVCRILYKDTCGNGADELFGFCKFENGELIPLDGDSYSLNDLYIKWEVRLNSETHKIESLTVWEDGYLTPFE